MNSISQPTLIINESIARRNIKAMAEKARKNKISFEPHFKTHQSKEVGEWFREEGVDSITVSSVSMALYFSTNGWNKITIAFPVNILEINKLNTVLKHAALTLLIQDVETVAKLSVLNKKVKLFIEIDAGYHRSGVEYNSLVEIKSIFNSIKDSKHSFKGFYCHAGNSYSARGHLEVRKIYKDLEAKMSTLKNEFVEMKPHIAIGDTPTCSVINDFKGIDSIHPGNFVYYDYTQVQIGSCQLHQVAAYLVCPIVAKNKERNELIIYGGGVHLSKEALDTQEGLCYGPIGRMSEKGIFTSYSNSFVKSISQEHGIISSNSEILSSIKVGDLITVIPIHSCMTVDCMSRIYTERGSMITKMII